MHYDQGQVFLRSDFTFVGRRVRSVRRLIPAGHFDEAGARRDSRLAHRRKHQSGARSDCRSGGPRVESLPGVGSRGSFRLRSPVAGSPLSVARRRDEPARRLGRIRRRQARAAGPGSSGDSLRAPFLNRPVDQIKARAEWKPGARHIALTSAQAFGARWSGTFDRRDPSGDWQFALSADHLAAADLDRWLNPAWRQSFLDRMLPFLNSRAQTNAAPENLRASGRLALDAVHARAFGRPPSAG